MLRIIRTRTLRFLKQRAEGEANHASVLQAELREKHDEITDLKAIIRDKNTRLRAIRTAADDLNTVTRHEAKHEPARFTVSPMAPNVQAPPTYGQHVFSSGPPSWFSQDYR